jgi:ubiquinone/menaquinone biosynthesis C-methylase UbiE
MSVYDSLAPSFDRDRAVPSGVAETIRAAVLAVSADRPRLLDLGAGTGRIGWPFVAAGDDYVGADLSFGMLHAFRQRAHGARLVRANGQRLPFPDAAFDIVMLIQVFGGMRGWWRLLAEARRVLRGSGALVLGRSVAPDDGVDARMKQRLASIVHEMDAPADNSNPRSDAQHALEAAATRNGRLIVAEWEAERTPRGFIERHRTGARFSALPEGVRNEAMASLQRWADSAFSSLDAPHRERHTFELRVFEFQEGTDC